jgi:DUF438 domain-containing protein
VFPLLAGLFNGAALDAMFEESRSFGFCFLEESAVRDLVSRSRAAAGPSEEPPSGACPEGAGSTPTGGAELRVDTGVLSLEVLESLFRALPVDMTFVNAAGKVAWFSAGSHRIFPRSPSVIGRDVRNCHPKESVDRVVAILEDFRAGTRERAEFWLLHRGRFIHIEYFALRDPKGRFLGTLEVSQDLTEKRALEGEKRL